MIKESSDKYKGKKGCSVVNGKLNQVFDAAYCKFLELISVTSLQVCIASGKWCDLLFP